MSLLTAPSVNETDSKKDKEFGSKSHTPTPKRLRTSIRFDAVHPGDYLKYDFRFACEDCTHFNRENQTCTLGYNSSWHRQEFQKKSYELSGKMALCRFLEID